MARSQTGWRAVSFFSSRLSKTSTCIGRLPRGRDLSLFFVLLLSCIQALLVGVFFLSFFT
ncbi:hypothetical protein CSUI_009691, partial [Cystoisospora suis]